MPSGGLLLRGVKWARNASEEPEFMVNAGDDNVLIHNTSNEPYSLNHFLPAGTVVSANVADGSGQEHENFLLYFVRA